MSEETRLRKRLKQIEEAKKKVATLRTLESYTDKEKIENFDKFFKFAQTIVKSKMKGKEDDDNPQWCFEMILNLLGKDVWDVYNKL